MLLLIQVVVATCHSATAALHHLQLGSVSSYISINISGNGSLSGMEFALCTAT
jgi:hypothetical protein